MTNSTKILVRFELTNVLFRLYLYSIENTARRFSKFEKTMWEKTIFDGHLWETLGCSIFLCSINVMFDSGLCSTMQI